MEQEIRVRNKELIGELQSRILAMQGLKRPSGIRYPAMGLGAIEQAFPGGNFPFGVIHEFISPTAENATATNGFISGLLGRLMQQRGLCIWISNRRTVFPSALQAFGIMPHRVIFIDLRTEKDVLWAVEEALKSEAVAAVVGELRELDFTQSRKLQLAVEKSRVTGFIHRHQPKAENTVTCVTRWKIEPVPGTNHDGLPGLGLPRWHVQLTKVRNGKPGHWDIEWANNEFRQVIKEEQAVPEFPLSVANYV
jgi:protein ImuA